LHDTKIKTFKINVYPSITFETEDVIPLRGV
jgi:hypothetical protein